ncbi:hypothetical protein BDP81DRAFT_65511 [Colletotrichum phormii]|uniref:Uncharacterized protein n=1 Tax=Colletotrichum phormii TaxID=359342 RepID=A0AAI9ZLD6_9PEZI|nr:uncharacterized protein BDP81DRAFT_65511 [Colletotrichum phormii]KAK1634093.1 hypothetical protein BDP81DRAFT_65511 [Colletotrichum phormii]
MARSSHPGLALLLLDFHGPLFWWLGIALSAKHIRVIRTEWTIHWQAIVSTPRPSCAVQGYDTSSCLFSELANYVQYWYFLRMCLPTGK